MHPTVDKIVTAAKVHLDTAAKSAARLDPHKLAWGSLVLAAITFLAVNLFASTAFRGVKMDLTRDGLYTISDGTRKALKAIDEPIDIRVYFSKRLGDAAPTYAKNFDRVRSLLERYRDISGGKLQVSFLDPEPFSDAEDRAVAAGLRGIRLNQEGDQGYFGLVGTNATDNEASIGFFSTDRERFLEYDVTKLVYTLANPKKRVIGMISSIPLEGAMPAMMRMGAQPTPPQMVMEQIREFFDVKTLEKDLKEIPADIDVLMLVQPEGLTPDAAYAIDQFALGGGKVLVFIDPLAETAQRGNPMGMPGMPPDTGEMEKLLKSLGRRLRSQEDRGRHQPTPAACSSAAARAPASPTTWSGCRSTRNALDQRDVLSARHRAAEPGLGRQPRQGGRRHHRGRADPHHQRQGHADRRRPHRPACRMRSACCAATSRRASWCWPRACRARPTAPSRRRAQGRAEAKKDEPARQAGRQGRCIKGTAQERGEAKGGEKAAEPAAGQAASSRPATINVDRHRRHRSAQRPVLGRGARLPRPAGGDPQRPQLGLRAGGAGEPVRLRRADLAAGPRHHRPALRAGRAPAPRLRAALPRQGGALTAKLKEVTGAARQAREGQPGRGLVLSDADRAAIEKFRAEMLVTRRELREVKRELRKDIDQLDGMAQVRQHRRRAAADRRRRRRLGGLPAPAQARRRADGRQVEGWPP